MVAPILEMKSITKEFPGVKALDASMLPTGLTGGLHAGIDRLAKKGLPAFLAQESLRSDLRPSVLLDPLPVCLAVWALPSRTQMSHSRTIVAVLIVRVAACGELLLNRRGLAVA